MILIISLVGLGPIVDEFVWLGSSFPLSTWGQPLMKSSLIYAEWFYIVLRIVGVLTVIWPFIYIFRRHRYQDPEPEDELWG